MIDLKPWDIQIARLRRGETIRVNHHACDAGQDRRQRLYLTRSASTPNIILGYCHNCQDKGFLTLEGMSEHKDFDPMKGITLPPQLSFAPPDNMTKQVADWPTVAQQWRISMKLDVWDCESMGIAYDPATHRIYLPQWSSIHSGWPQSTATLDGYQLRNLSDHGPKYLTAHRNRQITVSTVLTNDTPKHGDYTTVAVLVEDLASGCRVSKALNNTDINAKVVVNYGTKVSPEVLHKHNNYNVGLIWLDNDSEHVRIQADKMRNVWAMLSGKPTTIECKHKDPKHVPPPEIVNTIRSHIG